MNFVQGPKINSETAAKGAGLSGVLMGSAQVCG